MFPNLQALLAMHQQYHGFGGPMGGPVATPQPFQPGRGLFNSLPSILQRPHYDGNPGMIQQPSMPPSGPIAGPVSGPPSFNPNLGGGYQPQRPALNPQQIQGISQRMGMQSAY